VLLGGEDADTDEDEDEDEDSDNVFHQLSANTSYPLAPLKSTHPNTFR
jgi:hypothetical protein